MDFQFLSWTLEVLHHLAPKPTQTLLSRSLENLPAAGSYSLA